MRSEPVTNDARREGHRAREERTSGRIQISLQALEDAIVSGETCENDERAHNPLARKRRGLVLSSANLASLCESRVCINSLKYVRLTICALRYQVRVRVSKRQLIFRANVTAKTAARRRRRDLVALGARVGTRVIRAREPGNEVAPGENPDDPVVRVHHRQVSQSGVDEVPGGAPRRAPACTASGAIFM